MKVAKRKRYPFHPRIGRAGNRNVVVAMYKGVNLKHQTSNATPWSPSTRDLCAMHLGIGLPGPAVWRSGAEKAAQPSSDEEVHEMFSQVHSTHPIVVSIGVLSRSAA